MIVNQKSIYYQRLIADLLLLNLSFIVSAVLAQPVNTLLQRNYMFILLLILNMLWFINSSITGFYNELHLRTIATQLINLGKGIIVQIGAAILFIFITKEDLFTRNFIVFYGVLLFIAISLRTVVFKKILQTLRAVYWIHR